MNKKITSLFLTATIGLLVGRASLAATGDIYSITRCDYAGTDLDGAATISAQPFEAGINLYFKVRLQARDAQSALAGSRWYLSYSGLGSDLIANALTPMQIGVYVSGRLDYATYVTSVAEKDGCTAVIFSYTTKPGDFAMPIRLATASGPVYSDQPSDSAYYFNPLRSFWDFSFNSISVDGGNTVTNAAVSCNWTFMSTPVIPSSLPRTLDYSLEKCGFFVQTIDFSDDWETEDYWRTIHENSTITGSGVSPKLVADSAPEMSTTLYVWSDNENAVRIKGGTTVSMKISNSPETYKDVQVGTITFAGGQTSKDFKIEGATGGEDLTANIVLSAYNQYHYSNSSGERIDDEYVTVPVKCSEPLPASVIVECADTTVVADHDYLTAKTSLSVYLSQAATNDVTVTLKTTFEDDDTKTNWGDYVRFSASANTQSTLPDPDEITFTIPKGSTDKKIIYVYTLRGDSHTVGDGHQVQFTPYVSPEDKTAAGIESETSAGLWISAAKPVITTPDSTSAYDVTAGEKLEITVAVEDTYADMTDTNEGYTVRIMTGSTAGWTTLAEKFKASGEDGELVGITSGNPPSIEYPSAGEQTSQIQVTAPISGKKSEIVSFTVNVSPAKTTSATSLDEDPDNYTEGDVVKFRVSLSSQNDTGAPIYAFLLCNEDIDLSMFGGTASKAILTSIDTAVPASVGRQISTVGTFTDSSFTVLDGLSNDDGGQNYTFSVVLCSTKNYDPAHRLPGYDTTEMLNITVYNEEPVFDYVYLNGFETENGITFGTQFPRGQDQSIQPYFKDVSYDLKHGFEYKWTASRDGKAEANGIVAHNPDTSVTEVTSVTNGSNITTYIPDGENINDYPMVYNFPRAGTWTVKLQMKDKDMTSYAEETYSVIFDVLANPSVTITPEDSYDENNNKASIDVGLAYFDSDDSIVVKLTVTKPVSTSANLGTLILSDEFKTVPTGYLALADNEYYVVFDSATTISVDIDSMDGTVVSASKGFTLKAEVVSTGLAPDGTTWAEYYLPSSEKIYINNVMPEFGYVTQENTNAWKVAGGAATSYPINWAIRRDVDYDFTDPWSTGEGPGIKVTFAGCENATTFYVGLDDDWNGKFIPNFGSVQGEQNVILTIEDKDGGMNTWTYMYLVTPSKTIITVPNGPTGVGNSSLSQKYVAATGRGEGHLYPKNVTFSSATQNSLTWFGSGLSQVAVYGFGYKAGAVDNGYLDDGLDQAISSTGGNAVKPASATVTAGYYTYDSEFDSYLYGWIISTPTSEAGVTEWTFTMAPARPLAAAVPAYAMLPSAMTEDENFVPVMVEGIFSREFLVSDNLGDINLDGIPDLFVNTFSMLGAPATGNAGEGETAASAVASNDLDNLAALNDDLDKLPGFCAYGDRSGISKELQNSYADVGIDFTAIMEIRGFHEGLNDTHFTTSDAYFSDDEQLAWVAYATANGLDPAVYNLGEWSPEPTGSFPRMDPTVEDTDGDMFPDGWEYFFWYQAKVCKPAADAGADNAMGKPRAGQDFLFERYDPGNILRGIEITPDEVLARFNPCQGNTDEYAKSPDFDGDGLVDYEELLIGTNPCHWDTDGDVMPDGWEVMMNLDPLAKDKTGNADGDFMACLVTEGSAILDLGDGTYLVDINNNINFGNSDRIDGTTRELLVDVDGEWAIVVPLLDGNGNPVTYGRPFDEELGDDDRPRVWHWGYRMIASAELEELTLPEGTRVQTMEEGDAYIILHDQVRDLFGFDPRTGWFNVGGYVASRWDPHMNMSLETTDTTGLAVNTVAYCDYDEYLVMHYRNSRDRYPDDAEYKVDDIWATLGAFTTNPSVAYPVLSTNELDAAASTNATTTIAETLAQAFAQAGSSKSTVVTHGADTDLDGAPDGWELYVGRNPNAAPGVRSMEGAAPLYDIDRDGLGYIAEYSGTASCNAYKNCESIYSKHPGNATGWFNKFFPTDPDEEDTDGDGISDSDEGRGWLASFPYAGETYNDVTLSFIYGTPEDSLTCCVRGGGLNPCTVDTDLDGLPDAWEMQYAGIPTDATTRKYAPPAGAAYVEVDYVDSTWIADGIIGGFVGASNAVYIAAGMDGTWDGDGWTDVEDGGNSFDSLLGTLRDVDFDHDGLQNGQEYLVQQVRHFRYDDITTPLMGRYMDEGEYDTMNVAGPLLSNHTYVNVQAYVPMNQSADEFVANTLATWTNDSTEVSIETNVLSYSFIYNTVSGEIYTNATVEVVTNIIAGTGVIANKALGNEAVYNYMFSRPWDAEGWAHNGYFARPPKEWDRLITSTAAMSPVIMLPPRGQYVSTDPRLADTDMDGMDDYYEMFHGLNPILGTTEAGTPQDIIAVSYGQPNFFNAFYNEWTHRDFNRMAALMGLPGSVANPEPLQGPEAVDPLLYPWAMGANEVDADGDGLRNDSERIAANLTSPNPTHTDPTPLWFTDSTSSNSYVSLYYLNSMTTRLLPIWPIRTKYCYSFEENEGYDTDNDWVDDGREIVRTLNPPSDPLNFTDPVRRQALYLDGNQSWVQTREGISRSQADFYKQFTVEAWVYTEKTGRQTIIDRSCVYGYDNNLSDETAIRSNFRIGTTVDGNIYGMFDNDEAKESGYGEGTSCQTVVGPVLEEDVWTHVALTYNGNELVLYLNGEAKAQATTSLIPANGISAITQDPSYTNEFPTATGKIAPSALFIGGRPKKADSTNETIDGAKAFDSADIKYTQMRDDEWFKGYVDEVRIWDGARTEAQIGSWWNRHMTMDDAATNRLEVYTRSWGPEADSSRNDNDNSLDLTAELVQLYDFSTLPGAVNADDAAKIPTGFDISVGGQLMNKTDAFSQSVGWWDACSTKSLVYNDYTIVPWIENTVQHLKILDGSVLDSFLYSDRLGGYYTPAAAHNLAGYVLENTANPYPYYIDTFDKIMRLDRLDRLEALLNEEEFLDLESRYEFHLRSEFSATGGLVPMGRAYAKICPALWDGQGAASAWSQTGTDNDGDGLPDWWENLYGLDPNDPEDWVGNVLYPDATTGVNIPAWEAYLRDLAQGMQPDGAIDDIYKSTADANADGLLDWWQDLYAVTDGADDNDGDGLSNYVEYMLGEVFCLKGTDGKWLRFAPNNAYSVNTHVSDYFYRMNQLYVGEIFTDHDRTKDKWESTYLVANDTISPYLYDSDKDADGDGWSNYAEFQAGTDPTCVGSIGIDGVEMDEYPVPTVQFSVGYTGPQNVNGAPLVVKAWSDQTLATIPDARWTLGAVGETTTTENGNENTVNGLKYLGMNPMREKLIHLSPGSVQPGTVKIEFKDVAWILLDITTQQTYFYGAESAIWFHLLGDKMRAENNRYGDLVDSGTSEVVGSIDYVTGALTIDFTALREILPIDGNIAEEMDTQVGGNLVSLYNVPKSYVRVNWASKLTTGTGIKTYYLGDADDPDETNNTGGHLKEGKNTFIAFYDLDGDGMYTVGEPYGTARDVDVGWNYAKVAIELTDTTPITARYKLTAGVSDGTVGSGEEASSSAATDREVLYPDNCTDVFTIPTGTAGAAPEKDYVRVRLVRYAVDSWDIGQLKADYMAIVYDRVMDLTADGHPTLTEADILSMPGNEFDLDWAASTLSTKTAKYDDLEEVYSSLNGQTLADGKTTAAFTNIYYVAYVGNGTIQAQNDTNVSMLTKVIVRKFGLNRVTPEPISGSTEIQTTAPTFKWSSSDSTYTAFKIRVKDSAGKAIWTSDYQLMPPRDDNGVYSWTPPLRVGAIVPGGTDVFANGGTYTWEISTYNAKFKSDIWITGGTFLVNVLENAMDFGSAHVAVRYYGPSSVVRSSYPIRVQAFTTPDFSGEPVSEGYVTNRADIASTGAITKANAVLLGLKAGTYYIRAFVDTDKNGSLSTWTDRADRTAVWESWGAYCTRDVKAGTIFTPKSLTVGSDRGVNTTIPVFIEDCDSDQDSLPDAWEWVQNGNLSTYGANQIDQNANGFTLRTALAQELTASGSFSSGLSTMATTALKTPRVAALLLGVSATGSDSEVQSALNSAQGDATVEPVSIQITSIALDKDANTVTITADSVGTESGSAAVTSQIYTIPSGSESLTLTLKVWHCDELGAAWDVIATREVTITRQSTDYEFDLGTNIDLASGFFKVTLE